MNQSGGFLLCCGCNALKFQCLVLILNTAHSIGFQLPPLFLRKSGDGFEVVFNDLLILRGVVFRLRLISGSTKLLFLLVPDYLRRNQIRRSVGQKQLHDVCLFLLSFLFFQTLLVFIRCNIFIIGFLRLILFISGCIEFFFFLVFLLLLCIQFFCSGFSPVLDVG